MKLRMFLHKDNKLYFLFLGTFFICFIFFIESHLVNGMTQYDVREL